MNLSPSSPPIAGFPPPRLVEDELQSLFWMLAALALAVLSATIRAALQHSNTGRVLARAENPRLEARIEPLLRKVEPLAASAGIFEVSLYLLFATLLLSLVQGGQELGWQDMALTMAVAVPVILLVLTLSSAWALRHGDALLLRSLPAFHLIQLPLHYVVKALLAVRRSLLRVLHLPEHSAAARQIVEGLREVITDSAISGDLDETEREMIENVMEFRDVDVAAVMTPRTEIHGVDLEDGIEAAVREAAQCGHSRLPVYEGDLDTIIGTVSARGLVQVVAEGRLEGTDLRSVLHPPYFVPETKQVSDLLAEFRHEKLKIAIVLDEYGGTAGLVTLGDVVSEIVGEVHDEFDEETPHPVVELAQGLAEVAASLHVSEVNEALDLQIPEEEDYETLGGFVLAQFGRFPKKDESFIYDDVEFTVVEASDRRVITVRIRRMASKRMDFRLDG